MGPRTLRLTSDGSFDNFKQTSTAGKVKRVMQWATGGEESF
jgi:hypothetical protein